MTKAEKFALKKRLRERYSADRKRVYEIATEEIDRMKTTENKGEWIIDDAETVHGHCNKCGWESHYYEDDVVGMNFCPNCGADMRGGTDVER